MSDTAILERSPLPGTEAQYAPVVSAVARQIVLRTSGQRHGPITRLVSPSDVGELIKPFVFLDHAEVVYTGRPLFGIHPHSGIATLTLVLQGVFLMKTPPAKAAR
jgi:redox-sensitive bicupin YhaK (pirin superfamily)